MKTMFEKMGQLMTINILTVQNTYFSFLGFPYYWTIFHAYLGISEYENI